ncbi:hypothetical protein AKH17_00635 [Pelagibacteraceae bacterium GOM-A2]|nr:hypothetical protein AKH17_00635 [Pelagibacteraceae bacterium GOM-A2]
MKLFFLLGNQLFSEKYLEKYRKDHFFFMAEDYQLCTYEKHHKQKKNIARLKTLIVRKDA